MSAGGGARAAAQRGGPLGGEAGRRPIAKGGGSRAANRVGAILCVLVAAYFLVTAGYAVLNAGSYAADTPRFLRYVVGPLSLAGLLLLTGLRFRPEARLMTGLCSAAALIGLFAFEAVLTMRSLTGIRGLYGYLEDPQAAAPFQEALPPAFTLRRLNRQMNVSEPSKAMLGGPPGRRVLLCTSGGEPVSYLADRFGFRNPDEVHEAPAGLLVLGDSFAEGLCLEDGKDIAGHLREVVPGTVNTGTRGAGPLFELAILRRWGPQLRPPETVILFFAGNDMENLELELSVSYLRPLLDRDVWAGPIALDPAIEAEASRVIDLWWSSRGNSFNPARRPWLRNFVGLHQTAAILGLHYPEAPPDLPVYRQVLEAARAVVEGWDGRLTVVYIPQVDRFVGLLPNGVAFDSLRDRIRDAAVEAGVGFVDLTEPMAAAQDPAALYAPDAHFSEAGARLAAETIHRVICAHGAACAARD